MARKSRKAESEFEETPYNPVPFLTSNLDTTEIGSFHPADQLQKLVDHTNSTIEEQNALPEDTYYGPNYVEDEPSVGVDGYTEEDSGAVVTVNNPNAEAVKAQQDENLKRAQEEAKDAAEQLVEASEDVAADRAEELKVKAKADLKTANAQIKAGKENEKEAKAEAKANEKAESEKASEEK